MGIPNIGFGTITGGRSISIVKNDLPLPLLKALVGHSDDMDTYGVYGLEVNGEMRQAAKIIDQAFSKIVPIKPQK